MFNKKTFLVIMIVIFTFIGCVPKSNNNDEAFISNESQSNEEIIDSEKNKVEEVDQSEESKVDEKVNKILEVSDAVYNYIEEIRLEINEVAESNSEYYSLSSSKELKFKSLAVKMSSNLVNLNSYISSNSEEEMKSVRDKLKLVSDKVDAIGKDIINLSENYNMKEAFPLFVNIANEQFPELLPLWNDYLEEYNVWKENLK